MSEINEENQNVIKEKEEGEIELERNYLPIENYVFDWNMMIYGEDKKEFEIDWNKLIYNEDQLLEFDLKKNEKLMRPEYYQYMFQRASERTEIEKFYLMQSGFSSFGDENDSDEDVEETKIKRFIVEPRFEEEPCVSLLSR